MKIILGLFFLFGLRLLISDPHHTADDCILFKRTKIRDTLVLEATRCALVMLPKGSPTLKYLEGKKIIDAKNISATIFLKFNNCEKEIDFPLLDNSSEARDILSRGIGQKVRVTMLVLTDRNIPHYKNKPFVGVLKLRTM